MFEKATDWLSKPRLDRMLPCCDNGRRDSRLIQEPLDETDSLESSAKVGEAGSPCTREALLLCRNEGGKLKCWLSGRLGRDEVSFDLEAKEKLGERVPKRSSGAGGWARELVPGRDETGAALLNG